MSPSFTSNIKWVQADRTTSIPPEIIRKLVVFWWFQGGQKLINSLNSRSEIRRRSLSWLVVLIGILFVSGKLTSWFACELTQKSWWYLWLRSIFMEASLNNSQHPLELVTSFLSIFLWFLGSPFEIQDSVDHKHL